MKGVTESPRPVALDGAISIHTPVKGVTTFASTNVFASTNFNPHTREGCDLLAAEATLHGTDFNPHTREGCDEYI